MVREGFKVDSLKGAQPNPSKVDQRIIRGYSRADWQKKVIGQGIWSLPRFISLSTWGPGVPSEPLRTSTLHSHMSDLKSSPRFLWIWTLHIHLRVIESPQEPSGQQLCTSKGWFWSLLLDIIGSQLLLPLENSGVSSRTLWISIPHNFCVAVFPEIETLHPVGKLISTWSKQLKVASGSF